MMGRTSIDLARRDARRQLRRLAEIQFDQVVAAELFFCFSERAVRAGVLPSRTRTVVAVVVGCSASPAFMFPVSMSDCV